MAYAGSLLTFLVIMAAYKPARQNFSLKANLKLFWLAGVGQAVSWLLNFYALTYNEVAIVASLLSTEPVFVVLFAYMYLKKTEKVSLKLWLQA